MRIFWSMVLDCFSTFLGSGRSAKILEDPIVPQSNSYEVISHSDSKGNSLQDNSDRSLSGGNNMMLYRTVLTISMRLLMAFLVVRLLTTGLTSAGILRPNRVPVGPFPGLEQPGQPMYTVDVNHNPGLALYNGGSTIATGYGGVGTAALGTTLLTTGGAHAISTGAAAGASTGTAPVQGHYLAAGTQQRPSYLPLGPPPPRFRFFGLGGPRHPPRRPPPHMMPHSYVPISQHNLGEETQYIDTHTHLIVMPDGTQARVPNTQTVGIQTVKPQQTASPSSSSSSTTQQDSKSSASGTSENTTDRPPIESSSVSTSSASAERRSSVFKDRSSTPYVAHQPYDDWTLHFNAGV